MPKMSYNSSVWKKQLHRLIDSRWKTRFAKLPQELLVSIRRPPPENLPTQMQALHRQ